MAKKKKNTTGLENLAGFEWGGHEEKVYIPTGHSELDYHISRGEVDALNKENPIYGIPLGSVCMIYGGPGGGKSSLAYRICGNAQQMGYTPVWIDVESSYSPGLAEINGADPTKMGRIRMYDKNAPEDIYYAEKVLDKAAEIIKAGADVVVIDSIAALVTKAELENSVEKDTMAALARVLGKSIPALTNLASAHNCLLICINQLREKPGVMFGNPEGTKGGNALPHHCSCILKVNRLRSKDALVYVENEDGKDELIAGSANVWIEKSRFSMPHFDGIKVPIYYRPYFPDLEEIIFTFGRKVQVIKMRTGTYSWNDIKIDGRNEFIDHISNMDASDLVADIIEAARSKELPVPAEILNYHKHKDFESLPSTDPTRDEGDDDDSSKPKRKKKFKRKSNEEEPVQEASFSVPVDDNPEL